MPPNIHDSGYKLLFSNRTIFRQLIQTFVDAPWVKEADFGRCEAVDKSFISNEYRHRESDLIYRVALREQDIFIYVLIEFQSTVDRFMALRVLGYLTNFYLDYVRSHREVRRLPPIFPLVLYSGDRRWTAATEFAELIEGIEWLGAYSPRFTYYKLAENELSPERLRQIGNIVSTLFLAEQDVPIDTVVAALADLFDQEEDKQAVSTLVNWFRQMISHGRIDPADYAALATTLQSKEEVTSMFLKTVEREKKTMFELGRQEGREEGREEGIEEGREQGIELGILTVARRMLAAGIAPATVADVTGLSLDTVLTLQPTDDKTAPSATTHEPPK
ncbi:MAG: Rpn family recombination-promoting nuclease/putative transposase [Caldilineaceae bacterium]|nr:Rpn family recombination-promoting nuclease/putative transposase [Caldilineaceae bacterium]